LSGHTGTILGWESSLDNFATAGTYINYLSTAYTVTNLTATTSYRAIIQSGSCAVVRSSISTIAVAEPTKPVVQANTTITSGSNVTLTATGCQGSTGTYALKWYKSSDNSSVTMPISPTVTTSYYAFCEQTINTVTCVSVKSDDVTVTVNTGSVIISIKTGDWEDPTTWDAGRVPNANDIVIVDTAHTVSLNGAGSAKNVTQRGVLSMKNGSVLNLGF
jgi:hypothetical protein